MPSHGTRSKTSPDKSRYRGGLAIRVSVDCPRFLLRLLSLVFMEWPRSQLWPADQDRGLAVIHAIRFIRDRGQTVFQLRVRQYCARLPKDLGKAIRERPPVDHGGIRRGKADFHRRASSRTGRKGPNAEPLRTQSYCCSGKTARSLPGRAAKGRPKCTKPSLALPFFRIGISGSTFLGSNCSRSFHCKDGDEYRRAARGREPEARHRASCRPEWRNRRWARGGKLYKGKWLLQLVKQYPPY